MKTKIILFLTLIANMAIAGTGNIRGTVTDKATGETVIGAYVLVVGNESIGTSTDLDGKYSLKVEAGTYSLKFSSIGYADLIISDILVKEGQVAEINASLSDAVQEVQEIVVTAKRNQKSEVALMSIQKKSANVIDGISSESFSKSGDATAAAAIKRVPGVSIEGGKYVYVRGLGDRYTKTILNGMTIPGLDPDKNTVQMDLFPSNLIDKIVVYKTFTPDLPGDFTGGMVDVSTKDFPTRKTLEASLGYSYTTGMNFNKNFIGYQKGNMDWLGFAGKGRSLKFNPNSNIPDESLNDPNLATLSNSFSKELGVKKNASSFLNQNYSLSYGNQFEKKGMTYGFNIAGNYSNNYTFYQDVYQGLFFKDENKAINELDKRAETTGALGINEVLWSGLAGAAMKFKNHKLSATFVHSQNGVGKAADYISQDFDETNATLYKDAIEYSQKSVTNILFAGKHSIKDNKWEIDWKISPTFSKILEPDVRSTRLSYDKDTEVFSLQLGDGAGIDRYFRTLNEYNIATNLDFTMDYKQWSGKASKFKFGVSNTYKSRDYQILLYQFNKTNSFNDFSEDPNTILQDQNMWTAENTSGMYVSGNRDLNNEYQSVYNGASAYAMTELPLTESLKTIFGLRVENAIINYKGYYNNAAIDSMVHNKFAFLPSVNLIYKLNEDMNLRGSYTRTVARPSFKEKSNAHIDDPISQTVFIGNLKLQETNIDNADLRWEYFFNRGEVVSVSAFYKNFTNPIEMVPFELSPNNIQPKNIKNAMVYGAELEVKKNFAFINEKLEGLSVGANFTYILSRVNTKDIEVDADGTTEYDLRQANARNGETVKTFRPMQGQAPYLVNAFINYSNDSIGLEANLSYNVQGKRLAIVGSGIVPDVYEDPFHSLNFKISYAFGKTDNMKLSFSAQNLLGDSFKQFYESYEAKNQIYRSYTNGRSFSLGFNYKFF